MCNEGIIRSYKRCTSKLQLLIHFILHKAFVFCLTLVNNFLINYRLIEGGENGEFTALTHSNNTKISLSCIIDLIVNIICHFLNLKLWAFPLYNPLHFLLWFLVLRIPSWFPSLKSICYSKLLVMDFSNYMIKQSVHFHGNNMIIRDRFWTELAQTTCY